MLTGTIYVFTDSVCFLAEFYLIMINVNTHVWCQIKWKFSTGFSRCYIWTVRHDAILQLFIANMPNDTPVALLYTWFSYRLFIHRPNWVLHTVLHWIFNIVKWNQTTLVSIVITFKLLWLQPTTIKMATTSLYLFHALFLTHGCNHLNWI
jgi:hypothetical protein